MSVTLAVVGATPSAETGRYGGGREGSARNVYSRPCQRGRPDALSSIFLNGPAAPRTRCAQNLLSRYLGGAPRGRLITNGATESNEAGRVTRKWCREVAGRAVPHRRPRWWSPRGPHRASSRRALARRAR